MSPAAAAMAGPAGCGRVMALDVGEKTVGVAVTDPEGLTAQPLTTLRRFPDGRELTVLGQLAASLGVEEVVVGLPTRTDGRLGPEARRVRAFARRLQQACGLPIRFMDERYTTKQAERLLLAAGLSRQQRKQAVNHVAAAILLESYLQRRRVKPEG